MTPSDLEKLATRIYGRKHWKSALAKDIGMDVSSIHRMMRRDQVPGPVEVALRGLAEHRKQQVELERAARRLLPRLPKGYKKKNVAPRRKTKPVPPEPDPVLPE